MLRAPQTKNRSAVDGLVVHLVQQNDRSVDAVGSLNDRLPGLASAAADCQRSYLLFASLPTAQSTHTHTRLAALFPGLPGTTKVKQCFDTAFSAYSTKQNKVDLYSTLPQAVIVRGAQCVYNFFNYSQNRLSGQHWDLVNIIT